MKRTTSKLSLSVLALSAALAGCGPDDPQVPQAHTPEPHDFETWTKEECQLPRILEVLDGTCWAYRCEFGSQPHLDPKEAGRSCVYREDFGQEWYVGECNPYGDCLPIADPCYGAPVGFMCQAFPAKYCNEEGDCAE